MRSKELTDSSYMVDIIENHLKLDKLNMLDQKEIQKHKFEVVSKLVSDMFKYKNSKKCYNTISNLILLSLTSVDEECPVDIYNHKECALIDSQATEYIQQEIEEEIKHINKCIAIEEDFRETLSRFITQYDTIDTIVLTPKKKEHQNGLPN
ncbi:MAG: hypothetical protein ACTSR8_02245 [Promethearchaeota archaeon]